MGKLTFKHLDTLLDAFCKNESALDMCLYKDQICHIAQGIFAANLRIMTLME